MINMCLTGKSSGHDRPRLPMLQLLWGMVTGSNVDFAKLIWDELKNQIKTRRLQLTIQNIWLSLLDLHLQSNRPRQRITNYNKVEFAVKTVSIPKRKRSQTVTKEIRQSEEAIDDEVDSEETDVDEVKPLVRHRFTEVSIDKEADQRTVDEEERVDYSKKLKGLETLYAAAQFKLDMTKAKKAKKNDFFIQQCSKGSGKGSGVTPEVPDVHTVKCINEGAGMTLQVLDEPSDASSSSSSDSDIALEDICSDDDEVIEKPDEVTENTNEVTKKDDEVIVKPRVVTENADNVTMADEVQPAEQQVRNEEHGPNIEPASDTHADVQMSDAQPKKPEATIISFSHTLSSAEFTNQFLDEHVVVNLSEILKDLVETKVQSMVDVPVKQATPAALRHPLVDSTVTLIPDTTTYLSS
ncbi:hypothetical protein Tco_1104210 [Tanacetum coccineum]